MRYHIITFGCQMNKSDSERIAAKLENDGYKPALKMSEADLVVVNMCSVRQPAVDRILGLSQKFGKLKAPAFAKATAGKQNSKFKTVLTGCILKKDETKFRKLFDSLVPRLSPSYYATPGYQNNLRSYVPISNGCDNFCTYCVVPHTRGRLVCRNHKEILNEIKNAVQAGIKEIWLLGENVNRYCSDAVNFAGLLKMVNDIPGDFKIRFTSPNPADFTDELIDAMAKCKKVAHYLNLPLQSGDNKILKRMNRPYTVERYENLIKKIRAKIPDINLSTDIIVGFPGETKKQFENTVKLFKEMKFNIAYISKYSPRPGTAAFLLKDDVPIKEKKRREKILMNIIKQPNIISLPRR